MNNLLTRLNINNSLVYTGGSTFKVELGDFITDCTKTSGLEPLTFSLKEKHSTNRVLFSIYKYNII